MRRRKCRIGPLSSSAARRSSQRGIVGRSDLPQHVQVLRNSGAIAGRALNRCSGFERNHGSGIASKPGPKGFRSEQKTDPHLKSVFY